MESNFATWEFLGARRTLKERDPSILGGLTKVTGYYSNSKQRTQRRVPFQERVRELTAGSTSSALGRHIENSKPVSVQN